MGDGQQQQQNGLIADTATHGVAGDENEEDAEVAAQSYIDDSIINIDSDDSIISKDSDDSIIIKDSDDSIINVSFSCHLSIFLILITCMPFQCSVSILICCCCCCKCWPSCIKVCCETFLRALHGRIAGRQKGEAGAASQTMFAKHSTHAGYHQACVDWSTKSCAGVLKRPQDFVDPGALYHLVPAAAVKGLSKNTTLAGLLFRRNQSWDKLPFRACTNVDLFKSQRPRQNSGDAIQARDCWCRHKIRQCTLMSKSCECSLPSKRIC